MDIFLTIIASILMILGVIGSIVPIPGPPLSLLQVFFVLHLDSRYVQFQSELLWIFAIATVVVTVLDYVVPAWGTKKFGGSKWGVWGSIIGLIIGLFFMPFGIISRAILGSFCV